MSTLATVGIHNNLATGETRVTMRTANHKLARGIDVVLDVAIKQSQHCSRVNLLFHPWNKDIDYIFTDALLHGFIAIKLIVLGRYHYGVDALGHTSITILHSDLTLRVGTQIGHHLALFAYLCQRAHQQMSQVERHGHQIFCLIASIAKHHTLVASALLLVVAIVHAAVDIITLLVNGTENTA